MLVHMYIHRIYKEMVSDGETRERSLIAQKLWRQLQRKCEGKVGRDPSVLRFLVGGIETAAATEVAAESMHSRFASTVVRYPLLGSKGFLFSIISQGNP